MTRPSEEEEKYFQSLDVDLRRRLRDKLADAATDLEKRRQVAAAAGTDDLSIAERVAALGFSGDSARVFDLMPLVHVAWADGSITKRERAAIFRVLEQRGVAPESEGFATIASLLDEQPTEAFMRESLAVLRDLVGGEAGKTRSIVDLCVEVAAASGGFLGMGGRVSDDERLVIDEVAKLLGEGGLAKVQGALDE
jgi:tellurite resistance protein